MYNLTPKTFFPNMYIKKPQHVNKAQLIYAASCHCFQPLVTYHNLSATVDVINSQHQSLLINFVNIL